MDRWDRCPSIPASREAVESVAAHLIENSGAPMLRNYDEFWLKCLEAVWESRLDGDIMLTLH